MERKEIAVLYRSVRIGTVFQEEFVRRGLVFNSHATPVLKRKCVLLPLAMLHLVTPSRLGSSDNAFRKICRQVLRQEDKDVVNAILGHVETVAQAQHMPVLAAAEKAFFAKQSGTLSRRHQALGRRVISLIRKLTGIVTSCNSGLRDLVAAVAAQIPGNEAIHSPMETVKNGQLLNAERDTRSILEAFLDEVSELEDTTAPMGMSRLALFLDAVATRNLEDGRAVRADNANSVTLCTVHHSKGLEWDHVFVVRLNEGELPACNRDETAGSMSTTGIEEERRLCYVALSRARKTLRLSYTSLADDGRILEPSRFLKEIPRELTVEVNPTVEQLQAVRPPLAPQPPNEKSASAQEEGEAPVGYNLARTPFMEQLPFESRASANNMFKTWARSVHFQKPDKLVLKVIAVAHDKACTARRASGGYNLGGGPNFGKIKATLKEHKELAIQHAEEVIKYSLLPAAEKAKIEAHNREYFGKIAGEKKMEQVGPSEKQLSYLKKLGYTAAAPETMLEASKLIDKLSKM